MTLVTGWPWLLAAGVFLLFSGVAALLVYKYLLELRAAREQRKNEMVQTAIQLRWKQARLGKTINDEFQDDKGAGVALLLLDFTGPDWGRKFKCRLGKRHAITAPELTDTLRRIIDTEEQARTIRLSDRDIAIAECFDSLFYYFAQFEHYLESGLVQFEDLDFPARYYVDCLAKTEKTKQLFTDYINAFGLHEAERFANRFRCWRSKHSAGA